MQTSTIAQNEAVADDLYFSLCAVVKDLRETIATKQTLGQILVPEEVLNGTVTLLESLAIYRLAVLVKQAEEKEKLMGVLWLLSFPDNPHDNRIAAMDIVEGLWKSK